MCKLRNGKALDIVVKGSERELSRETRVQEWNTSWYSRVHISGVINLKNYKSEPATIDVSKEVVGMFEDEGSGVATKYASININPTSRLKWKVTLKAGEKTTLSYVYTALFPGR